MSGYQGESGDSSEVQADQTGTVVICGSSAPKVGSRVPLQRRLHDNGFGSCALYKNGTYFCSFAAFPSMLWSPSEQPIRSLAWVEKKIAPFDKAPWLGEIKWTVQLAWPFQDEDWERVEPRHWIVTRVGEGIA